jgi:hypothetical protein
LGQYKVPQDVEAEDHILGPLTFRQFIYGLMGFGWGALSFAIFRGIPVVMIIVGFPPTMLLLLLAFYTRDGQNFEQILIAMVGFFAASRKRLWVKEDAIETYHVEAAPQIAEVTQRDPDKVMSELEKISRLIDSRGWNLPQEHDNTLIKPSVAHENRLVTPDAPQGQEDPGADMLDLQQSPLAQNLANLLQGAQEDAKAQAVQQMGNPVKPHHRRQASSSISDVTPNQSDDILKLATQSDDLSVSQVAAQATRIAPPGYPQQVESRPYAR